MKFIIFVGAEFFEGGNVSQFGLLELRIYVFSDYRGACVYIQSVSLLRRVFYILISGHQVE
jgi:hypothetical protein